MSIYLLLYFVVGILLLILWFKAFKKYWKFIYWKYFFVSIFFYFIWLALYLSAFTTIYNKDILLILSRLMYWTFLIAMYSMLFFVIFFNNKNSKKLFRYNLIIILTFSIFFFLAVFTEFIIKDMVYSEELQYHYEEFWFWILLYSALHVIYNFLFIILSYFTIKKLNNINKIRFKYISLWFLIFMICEVIFLGVLPLFNIWILQKEQILFFVPFIVLTWYSITRYHFLDIKIWIWKVFVFTLSIFWSLIFVNILRAYYLSIDGRLINFWWFSRDFWVVDCIVWIFLFFSIYRFLSKSFLWNNSNDIFYKQLSKLKKKISFITNIVDLNYFLWKEFVHLFKIKMVNIQLFTDEKDKNLEIYKFFTKNTLSDLFINDVVFIEENKYKFDLKKIKKEINKEIFLILPLYNFDLKLIWIFSLWKKPFKDYYFTEDVNNLKDFVSFLEWHLKYLHIYSEINDLNVNLDKKVDEKTIEYNNLINKQKEFINVVSHEVKWPVAWSLFQGECILYDIEKWKYNKEYLLKEIGILNKELLKTWDLVNNLFSTALYEVKGVKLYKENINLKDVLKWEVHMFSISNKNIKFKLNLKNDVWLISLDKIQFIQVIDNLLTNAVKFSKNNKWVINVGCFKMNKNIIIEVEDNWEWFNDLDITTIFDKYSTWNVNWIWLWMWLYLCKTIVELHNWVISASVSDDLWWAKFTIKIPIQ